MIIKTKKYQLDKKVYVRIALMTMLKRQWWYAFGPILFACIAFVLPSYKWWFIIPAILTIIGYIAFWAIQFTGVTQVENGRMLFEKLSYEIDSRQVLIKLDARQGSVVTWDMIKHAYKEKDYFLLSMNKAMLIHLPFKIFNSDNDIRFMEYILKNRGYLKATEK